MCVCVLEPIVQTRLASHTEISLPLLPECPSTWQGLGFLGEGRGLGLTWWQ